MSMVTTTQEPSNVVLNAGTPAPRAVQESGHEPADRYSKYKVLRRNGNVAPFEPSKIHVAMTKAFLAAEGAGGEESSKIRDVVNKLAAQVVETLLLRLPDGGVFHIEHIQDQVEIALMRAGEHEVARGYVLYREKRARQRASEGPAEKPVLQMNVTASDGTKRLLDRGHLLQVVQMACTGLGEAVSAERICDSAIETLYDGVQESEVWKALIFAARALIEKEPGYAYVSARLLLHDVRREVLGEEVVQDEMRSVMPSISKPMFKKG